jgi:phosphoribosylformimino-5-aminoimidazole carboxamide ribotide isomerase
MLIIPAIDILNGKLVRLEKGKYENYKTYYNDPFEAAKNFADYNFNLIHIVDLSGSKDGKINCLDLVKQINKGLNVQIQFGGGIRTVEDVRDLFESGAEKVIIGSISISDKNEFEKICKTFDSERIICAVDAKNELVKIKGWRKKTEITIQQHIKYCMEKGVRNFICTDIDRDGMLTGPNIKLYNKLVAEFPDVQIIASGGVSKIEDIKLLRSTGVKGVVIGKAIYENKIDLKELAEIAC